MHSRDIRKAPGDFGILTNPEIKLGFMRDLTAVMADCNYQLIAVAVHKERHQRPYAYPADPYDLSLLFCSRTTAIGTGRSGSALSDDRRGESR